jgi:hypothetical protein
MRGTWLGGLAMVAACGGVKSPAEPDAAVDDPPDAEGDDPIDADDGCVTDGFEGSTLAAHWELLAGAMPTVDVSGSRLLISDAPFADTPSVPGESWINEMDLDKGNQIAWPHAIGGGDFSVEAAIAWSSSAAELTLGYVGVSDAQGFMAAGAGINDGVANDFGGAFGQIKVDGDADLNGLDDRVENGSTVVRLERVDGTLTIEQDGVELVAAPVDDLISYVVIQALPYRQSDGDTFVYGSFEVRDVTVCQ